MDFEGIVDMVHFVYFRRHSYYLNHIAEILLHNIGILFNWKKVDIVDY